MSPSLPCPRRWERTRSWPPCGGQWTDVDVSAPAEFCRARLATSRSRARTLEILRRDGQFGISVLHAGQREVARAFAQPGAIFPDELTERYVDGYVLVKGALAAIARRDRWRRPR